jgi:hypothetical protein
LAHSDLFHPELQSDRKVTQPIPDTSSICQKMTLKSENKKHCYIKCWKCPPRPDYCNLTPKFDRNGFCPVRFLCHGSGSPDEILSICLVQGNREMYS